MVPTFVRYKEYKASGKAASSKNFFLRLQNGDKTTDAAGRVFHTGGQQGWRVQVMLSCVGQGTGHSVML